MNEREQKHLESISPFYEKGDYMDRLMIEREMEIIRRYIRPGASALEIGCGDGFSTEKLAALFDAIEVIEPSLNNTRLMRKRLPSVACHNVLIEDFQTEKKFDFIFFLNVIEHVDDPIASLRLLHKMLRDEGLIFISAPNCMSLNRRAGFLMKLLPAYDQMAPKDHEVGHRRLYTVEMLRDHCEAAGLRVMEMKGIYLKPLAESQMNTIGDAAVRAFCALGEDIPHYCAGLLAIATKKYY